MKLTRKEMGCLRVAVGIAIESEEALIGCHWNSITKRHFSIGVVRGCRARIKAMRRVDSKLQAMMAMMDTRT